MGKNTKIEWAHHTFNPWIGCTKVFLPDGSIHPACMNCYAEAESNRRGWAKWGKGKPRKRTVESNWKKPLAWDRAAAKLGIRERVFCASLSDIFDAEVSQQWRDDLFALIDKCPNLDWLILTKRPENIMLMIPPRWKENPPSNILMGASVSDQPTLEEFFSRLVLLRDLFQVFLSIEPLLAPVDLIKAGVITVSAGGGMRKRWVDWIIVGGESGPKARPMNPVWVRDIRDQCAAAGIPFLFKQWGEFRPIPDYDEATCVICECTQYNACPGGCHWIADTMYDICSSCKNKINRIHHFEDGTAVVRVGKKAACRLLDEKEYSEFPEVKA